MMDGERILEAGYLVDVLGTDVPRLENLRLGEAPDKPSCISYPTGSFLVCKVKPILRVRGMFFQPEIFSYLDETELAIGLWSHGLRSISLPIEVGVHLGSASFSKYSLLVRYLRTRNRFALLKSYWREYLKIFANMTKLYYIQKIPLMILRGKKE